MALKDKQMIWKIGTNWQCTNKYGWNNLIIWTNLRGTAYQIWVNLCGKLIGNFTSILSRTKYFQRSHTRLMLRWMKRWRDRTCCMSSKYSSKLTVYHFCCTNSRTKVKKLWWKWKILELLWQILVSIWNKWRQPMKNYVKPWNKVKSMSPSVRKANKIMAI